MTSFYEELVPRAEAELAALRGATEPALARLQVEGVALGENDSLEVRFRDPARPDCLFGWRWSWAEDPQTSELDFAAQMLRVNFEEDLLSERYGLPPDCVSGGVTWI